jgi:hypothetical protein
MSDSNGTGSNTQVSAIRCMWVSVFLSYQAYHSMPLSPEDLALVALPVLKARACLLGSWVFSTLGHGVGLRWVDRW